MPFLSSGSSRLSLLIFLFKGKKKSFQDPQWAVFFKETGIKIKIKNKGQR